MTRRFGRCARRIVTIHHFPACNRLYRSARDVLDVIAEFFLNQGEPRCLRTNPYTLSQIRLGLQCIDLVNHADPLSIKRHQ
jgi:hypothetical protein